VKHAIILIFLLPFAGSIVTSFSKEKLRRWLGVATAVPTATAVVFLTLYVTEHGAQRYLVGGWLAPLGINLYADGLSLLMLLLTATIGIAVSCYSVPYFSEANEPQSTRLFWPLWLFLWGGLNCLFVSGDLFNLYLLLETTLVAAVALAALGAMRAARAAALLYLLSATTAGVFYLFGVALLYSETRTLDLRLLHELSPSGPIPLLALGLMSGSLALKSALFPLHFWLPGAHSAAPAPVSAVLSGLVVKAGVYLILRLWLQAFSATPLPLASEALAGLGALGVLWGSWQAVRQVRLKLLVAYSTVAQIGYLFLLFPLLGSLREAVLSATTYQIISHGLAKTGMFLAAGALHKSARSDLIERTRGSARNAPLAVLAIIGSGAVLAGALPGGGAKGKILAITWAEGQWWWSAVVVAGMMLTAVYTFVAVNKSFLPAADHVQQTTARGLEITALLVAAAAIALSFGSSPVLSLLAITSP
jgi:multicomponent Na+:H+ antiporter subunit D